MSEGLASERLGSSVPQEYHARFSAGMLAPNRATVPAELTSKDVRAALARLTGPEIEEALRHRLFPVVCTPRENFYAAAGPAGHRRAEETGRHVIAEVSASTLLRCLHRSYADLLRSRAECRLALDSPQYSARRRVTGRQILAAVAAGAALAIAAAFAANLAVATLAIGFAVFFLAVIGLRLLSLMDAPGPPAPEPRSLADNELPPYTVLVPLFRETSVLRQIVGALLEIRYPREKLDIKLVLEECDFEMREHCSRLRLPAHIETIVVPSFGPQTKPKALNYALSFARGELVTIFDAEDLPDPDQLRLAATTFAAAPPQLACLQAKLAFYDAGTNWLTKQFAIEYASLFGMMLPMLASLGLPLPLGGTSNHFRTSVLRRVGAWDPYNVTEDADLGLRLARWGYRTGTLDSLTLEEPNERLGSWLNQRARWLKGWMQTWLVHMREPLRLHAELGWQGFWAVQAMVGGIVVSALLHPFFLGLTIWSLASGTGFPAYPDVFTGIGGAASLTVLFLGYAVSIAVGAEGLRRQRTRHWRFALLTMPIYWLLISCASWLALWQFIRKPFLWNKTQHGLHRARAASRSQRSATMRR